MSENMEAREPNEVQESSERQDTEGQRLEEATTAPEAHVEETQTFQQAEAVEAAFTELVATSTASAASGTVGEVVESVLVADVNPGLATEEQEAPIEAPGEEISWDPDTGWPPETDPIDSPGIASNEAAQSGAVNQGLAAEEQEPPAEAPGDEISWDPDTGWPPETDPIDNMGLIQDFSTVESILDRVVTDAAFQSAYLDDPVAALGDYDLEAGDQEMLGKLDPQQLSEVIQETQQILQDKAEMNSENVSTGLLLSNLLIGKKMWP